MSLPFIYVFIFPQIPYCFNNGSYILLKSDDFPTLLFFQIILLSLLFLHINFRVILSINTKILVENSIEIILNLYLNLERINILLFESFI